MQNNFHSPSYQMTIKILQSNAAWQALLSNLCYGTLIELLYKLPDYYDLLVRTEAKFLQL